MLAGDDAIMRVFLGGAAGMAAYLLAVRLTAAVAEERKLLKSGLVRSAGQLRAVLRPLRASVKRFAPLRSAWYLGIVLHRRLTYRSATTSASLDRLFEESPDPWRYDAPAERNRHAIAEEFVARIAVADGLARVMEIGCAEGSFSERLAPRCGSLLSLDVSTAALERARRRRDWGEAVRFARLDLLTDSIQGRFTTIVVMDVLTYFESVGQLRVIREKLVGALEPHGWLLVGDVRQSEVYESSWWGRALLCGGLRICEFVAAHRELELVASLETDTHVFRLLRKRL
jgi:2-polyprenyl-3-methyl-5-hydroxy-6-metoxy-1,4-benzoquinol methylase